MRGFGDAKPRSGKGPRFGELVPTIEWPEGDYEYVRIIGPVFAYCNIWFTIATANRPAPKGVSIPKLCLDLDGATDEFVTDVCPYRKSGLGREQKWYAVNVIVRSLQENGKYPTKHKVSPEKHLGYKAFWGTKEDAKRTPVRVLIVSESAAQKIQNLKKLNKLKSKKTGDTKYYDISDPEYGCDIGIMINPKAKGAAKIEIQKGDRTPLSDEEKRYLMFPLDLLKPERLEEAKREIGDLAGKVIKQKKTRDEDDVGGSKKKKNSDDEDDLAELDEDDLDLEDDEMPKKKKKKSRDDEDDDDDRPRKKKKKKSRDDEDDEDEDDVDLDEDLDDDDEDDRRSKKSKKKKKKARDEEDDEDEDDSDDDDDSDSDDDDEDEDDSDDDEDSEDDDDDEDEEEERPRKKKKNRR